MEYLIRFSQRHETFRLAEIEALAVVQKVDMKVLQYDIDSPFCVVRLPSEEAAKAVIQRCVLAQAIFELWGQGASQEGLHADVKTRSAHLWGRHATASFKFNLDCYRGTRPDATRLALIDGFAYLPLRGDIKMRGAAQEFTLFEHWAHLAVPLGLADPERCYMGRRVAGSARDLVGVFDLKKRRYISTTSMDSELALVTANIALAAPGKLFYDPFAGTGSFPLAAAQWGALAWGSDIDGASMRGQGPEGGLRANFEQYGLLARMGGVLSADLTHSPIRRVPLAVRQEAAADGAIDGAPSARAATRLFDGIICDPPYGVREGLQVLGCRNPEKTPWVVETGRLKYKEAYFVPPKQPYGFLAILDDILLFAAETLVDGGRLSFWMPTANDKDQEIAIPTHPCLEVVVVCTQPFNKWSRRLITYRRIPDAEVDQAAVAEALLKQSRDATGAAVDELNPFRRGYFNKFVVSSPSESPPPR